MKQLAAAMPSSEDLTKKLLLSHSTETRNHPSILTGDSLKVIICYFDSIESKEISSTGIRENVKLIDRFYNRSWVMRLYYDINQTDDLMETLCDIACEFDTLDLCFVR